MRILKKHFNGKGFSKCTAQSQATCKYGNNLHFSDTITPEEENKIIDDMAKAQMLANSYYENRLTKSSSGYYTLKNYNYDSDKDRMTEYGFLKKLGFEYEGTQVSKSGEFYSMMNLAVEELNFAPTNEQEEFKNSQRLYVIKNGNISPVIQEHLQSYIEASKIMVSDEEYLKVKDCNAILEDSNCIYIWPDDNFSADIVRIIKNPEKEKSFVSSFEVKTLCNGTKSAQGSTKTIYYDDNGVVSDVNSGEILADDYDVLEQGYHNYRIKGYDGVRDLISDYEERTIRMPGNKNVIFIDKDGRTDTISCSKTERATKKREDLINSGKYIGDMRIHVNKSPRSVGEKEVDYFLNSKVNYGRAFKDGVAKTEFTLSDLVTVKGGSKTSSKGAGVWHGEIAKGKREYEVIMGNFRKRLTVDEYADFVKGGKLKLTDFRFCPVTCSVELKDVTE